MPAVSIDEAAERLANSVERAKPTSLLEIYTELFPDRSAVVPQSAADLARHIRSGLEAEEIVDLWNVVFPADRNVWYDEEDDKLRYNEEVVGYADAD